MRYLEIIDIKIDQPNLYIPSAYPKTALYDTGISGYILVNKESGTTINIGQKLDFEVQETLEVKEEPYRGFTENFILKAIAIAQDPNLAEKLIEGTK